MRDRRGSGAGFSSPMLMFGSPPPPSPPPPTNDAVSNTESESDLRGRKGPLKMKCWQRARIGLCVCVYACERVGVCVNVRGGGACMRVCVVGEVGECVRTGERKREGTHIAPMDAPRRICVKVDGS